MKPLQFTALLELDGEGYVATCPELDVTSQGDTREDALANLTEAVELFVETAPREEIERRCKNGMPPERFIR